MPGAVSIRPPCRESHSTKVATQKRTTWPSDRSPLTGAVWASAPPNSPQIAAHRAAGSIPFASTLCPIAKACPVVALTLVPKSEFCGRPAARRKDCKINWLRCISGLQPVPIGDCPPPPLETPVRFDLAGVFSCAYGNRNALNFAKTTSVLAHESSDSGLPRFRSGVKSTLLEPGSEARRFARGGILPLAGPGTTELVSHAAPATDRIYRYYVAANTVEPL